MLYINNWQFNDYAPIPSLLSAEVIQSIWGFVQGLKTIAQDLDADSCLDDGLETWILEAIRQVSQTEQVLRVQYFPEAGAWHIVSKSYQNFSVINDRQVLDILEKDLPAPFWSNQIFKDCPQGVYRLGQSVQNQENRAYSVIPLLDDCSCLLMIGLPVQCNAESNFESPFLNDQFTYLVSSFYKNSLRFYKPSKDSLDYQLQMIEASILDDLKYRYGFIPKILYDRRFALFQEGLARTKMHFEPILDLHTMALHGWEALARDPFTQKAPVDLFNAAELWGLQFTVTLDITLLISATQTFAQRLKSGRNRFFPLFVNVYPESLMVREYFEQIRQLTQGDHPIIDPDYLILEISERKKIPFDFKNPGDTISLDTFKAHLEEYTKELGIQFGIDDFGVGYSSVHRFTALNLPYVKIDREILHQKPFDAVIRFVKEVLAFANPQNHAEIIVEGIDTASPVGIKHLKSLGIRFVQGYLIGEAHADPNHHTDTKFHF
jgi:EAL domain-containing protein (putative c-di-GMP-specific phosphodiesterase class I)